MRNNTTHFTCYMCTEDCPITVLSDGEDILSIQHPDCVRAEGMLEQRTSRHLETLKSREPKPRLQMNHSDAEVRSIGDGDEVRLSSPLGAITLHAWITDVMPPGVVSAPHGWADADVNLLIPDAELDPISGFPTFRSSLCQAQRLDGPGSSKDDTNHE